MRGRRRLVVTLYVSVALATTAVVLVLWAGEVLRSADLETANVRFSAPCEHAAPDVVVGIDAGTFATVKRLPFSRTLHARVIGGLRRAGAKVIAYDVQFGAQEMAGPALEEVNTWIRARSGENFTIGIGLKAGPVMAGQRRQRATYGVHDDRDTTSIASRLASMTKGTVRTIFLAESARRMLTSECGDMVRVDEMQVRGKDEPVAVWSIA